MYLQILQQLKEDSTNDEKQLYLPFRVVEVVQF